MSIAGLNTLDYLLLFILFLGAVVGFLRGAVPQIISMASIWFGLLGSLWLYRPLSRNILSAYLPQNGSDTMAFLILLIVFFHSIRLIVKTLTVPPEEKKKKRRPKGKVGVDEEQIVKTATQKYISGPFHAFGGIFMGIVLTALWTALILGVLQFIFRVNTAEAANGASDTVVQTRGIAAQLQGSGLLGYFNQILRWLVRSVSLFEFNNTPNILEVVINRIFPPG